MPDAFDLVIFAGIMEKSSAHSFHLKNPEKTFTSRQFMMNLKTSIKVMKCCGVNPGPA